MSDTTQRAERRKQTASDEPDPTMRSALTGVAIAAGVLTAGALLGFGGRTALGVAIGGAAATANLWLFGKMGRAFLSRQGNAAPWVVLAFVKLLFLLGGMWLLLRSGVVSPLALAVGYGALPVGITVGSLLGPTPGDEPPASAKKPDGEEDVLDADRPAGGQRPRGPDGTGSS